MPEQLTLEVPLTQRRTAHVHEGAAPLAQTVQHVRDQFLPRAGLAGNEHRAVAGRHLRHDVEHRLERRILRHDLRCTARPLELRLEQYVLAREPALLPRAPHQHVDLRHAIRLGHVVVGAELHRTDGRLDGTVAGDDDHLRRVGICAHLLQHLQAVQLRHHDVEQRHVVRFRAQRLERGTPVRDGMHRVPAARQEIRQDLAEVHLVLRHQHLDLRLAHVTSSVSSALGRMMRKTLPSPGALSTSMRPSCSATIA